MSNELIIQTLVITTAILFPFITAYRNAKKQQKELVLQKVRS